MPSTRLLLIEPQDTHRRCLEELCAAGHEFAMTALSSSEDTNTLSDGLPRFDAALIAGRALDDDPELVTRLRAEGFSGPVFLLGKHRDTADDHCTTIDRPFRFAALENAIRTQLRLHDQSDDARFRVGRFTFRPDDRTLVDAAADREPVRLTEKEAAILRYLHKAEGHPVPREELLGEVWGYGSGVTTHTLETHVYRLRQKIEDDAATHRVLITEDRGYRLKSS